MAAATFNCKCFN